LKDYVFLAVAFSKNSHFGHKLQKIWQPCQGLMLLEVWWTSEWMSNKSSTPLGKYSPTKIQHAR